MAPMQAVNGVAAGAQDDAAKSEVARISARLKERLLARLPEPMLLETAIDGLGISRREEANACGAGFREPTVCLVVQGSKCTVVGQTGFCCGESQFIVAGMELPCTFCARKTWPGKPFLAVSLRLDGCLLSQLAAEMPPLPEGAGRNLACVAAGDASPQLMDAFLRLVCLLDRPEQIPVLAPLAVREIHYLLLAGPCGESLRRINTRGTRSHQIAQAVAWLRVHYASPLKVEELARSVNMALSTFHRHFKTVTGMSPLQCHKHLRLHKAQRLMVGGGESASRVASLVGYESEAQFNREYKRLFGSPPSRDAREKTGRLK